MTTRKLINLFIVLIVFLGLSRAFLYFDIQSMPYSSVTKHYIAMNAKEQGIPNIVTGVVVGYRALDTIGELIVLFLVALAIKTIVKINSTEFKEIILREASPIVKIATRMITPFIYIFSIYIIIHGHLTPGGGFQGGAIFASGTLLYLLCCGKKELSYLKYFEGGAGLLIMLLALISAAITGFYLVNFLPPGPFGQIVSGGLLTIFYILIGIKVASEISGLIVDFLGES